MLKNSTYIYGLKQVPKAWYNHIEINLTFEECEHMYTFQRC